MTRKEATQHLRTIKIYSTQDGYTDEAKEALDMAIKALEQEPCEDAISRQALYELIDGWKEKNKYYHPHTKNEIIPICEVIDIIQSLPSVTPQPKTDVLDKIRAEIEEWYWQADKQALAKDPCVVDAMVDLFIRMIKKYESEDLRKKDAK